MTSAATDHPNDRTTTEQQSETNYTGNNNNNNNNASINQDTAAAVPIDLRHAHVQMEQPPFVVAAAAAAATTASQELPLQWTQLGDGIGSEAACLPIRFPSDVIEITPEETSICVVGTAGQKITKIGPDFYRSVSPELSQLIFRSHLIRVMEGLEFDNLDLLELYDNQVEELTSLDTCGKKLRILDMSYNVIRSMEPVSLCENLEELCKWTSNDME
jgi:Leucine-rich repeat (LRR) protein